MIISTYRGNEITREACSLPRPSRAPEEVTDTADATNALP